MKVLSLIRCVAFAWLQGRTYKIMKLGLVTCCLTTKQDHDRHVQEVQQDAQMAKQYGVKASCPLSVHLEHFHVVDGFPTDILHDLLEGIVPSELCLCIQEFIKKKSFTLQTHIQIKQTSLRPFLKPSMPKGPLEVMVMKIGA